jgi:hypothetical protein
LKRLSYDSDQTTAVILKTEKCQLWWIISVIPAMQGAEIWRTKAPGQPRQKVSKTPISTNKPGMVVHLFYPSYVRDASARILVRGQLLAKNGRPYLKIKELGAWLKWYST